ncbi:hypothetical protein BG006_008131 [Podila minutissima]|uniref:MARVEL domain-containing protein n=1 Tax=Podila minutissima TaxID=64525 RepID=A0A9P5SG63_9FUNG|nr:hypothetical protein BG006_008131 [Podila minutissima]
MNLSPTSRTLFLVQIGTFFAGVIVVACNCLYISDYPKSPGAGSLSAIACGTLAFSLLSTLITLVLILRQKSGRTIGAAIEGVWVGLAILLWILAAVGGIAKPANGMTHVSCKVLPDGKDTNDKNFIRACQSIFASTAFCIVSALFFMAIAGLLMTFSIQRASRDKKAAKVKVGGTYALGPSPSQYRRAEQNGEVPTETPKDEESTGANAAERDNLLSEGGATPAMTATSTGFFSENVYRTPVLTHATTPAPVAAPTPAPIHQSPVVQMPYNTYSGHAPQPSYHSQGGSYDYSTGQGHFQQGSAFSNPGGYDQFTAGYPPMQQSYPPQHQQMQQMPMQMQQQQQIPYGTQQYSTPLPHQTTPIVAMPRPEHF